MSVRFVAGDLFAAGLPALAHGCNCAGAMGRGIATEFRARWPAMYEAYRARCAAGEFRLGDVFAWREGGTTVYNLGTQRTWRTRADLAAVDTALRRMVALAEADGVGSVGLPRVGAGLGGLPWDAVRPVIEAAGRDTDVELVVFEHHVAGAPPGAAEPGRPGATGAG